MLLMLLLRIVLVVEFGLVWAVEIVVVVLMNVFLWFAVVLCLVWLVFGCLEPRV